jgi:hypothetical protein
MVRMALMPINSKTFFNGPEFGRFASNADYAKNPCLLGNCFERVGSSWAWTWNGNGV